MFFLQCALVGQWNLSHYTHGKTRGQKYFTFLKDKIFKSWTKCSSPPTPPPPPQKKMEKNLEKLKKGNKPFLLCVTFSIYLPRSWMSCSVWKTMAQEIIFYQRKKNRLPLNHSREWRNSIIQDHKFYNKREREKVNKQTLLETRSSYASFGNSMYHSII